MAGGDDTAERKKKLEEKLKARREKKTKQMEEDRDGSKSTGEKSAPINTGGGDEHGGGGEVKMGRTAAASKGLHHAVNKFLVTKRRFGGSKKAAKAAEVKIVEGKEKGVELEEEDSAAVGSHENQLEGAMQALQTALVNHSVGEILDKAEREQKDVGGGKDKVMVEGGWGGVEERPRTTLGRARRTTRQERLVAWTPSPEKKKRLVSMFKGVPVNAKPETILDTKFTALKSDAVLLESIRGYHGVNVGYRRKTCAPSDSNIRRLLDFVKEKRKVSERNWKGTKEGKKQMRKVKSKKNLKELLLD